MYLISQRFNKHLAFCIKGFKESDPNQIDELINKHLIKEGRVNMCLQ